MGKKMVWRNPRKLGKSTNVGTMPCGQAEGQAARLLVGHSPRPREYRRGSEGKHSFCWRRNQGRGGGRRKAPGWLALRHWPAAGLPPRVPLERAVPADAADARYLALPRNSFHPLGVPPLLSAPTHSSGLQQQPLGLSGTAGARICIRCVPLLTWLLKNIFIVEAPYPLLLPLSPVRSALQTRRAQ